MEIVAAVAKPETLLTVLFGIGRGIDSSSCQPGTPGNHTEVEAIKTLIVAVDMPPHTTVTDSVVAVAVT